MNIYMHISRQLDPLTLATVWCEFNTSLLGELDVGEVQDKASNPIHFSTVESPYETRDMNEVFRSVSIGTYNCFIPWRVRWSVRVEISRKI